MFNSSLSQEYHHKTNKKHHTEDVKLTALYAFRKGDSISTILNNFKISRTTFFTWRKQWETIKNVKPLKKTGRKPKLDNTKKQLLLEFYNQNPTATNEQGSAYLNNEIKPRTMNQKIIQMREYLMKLEITCKKAGRCLNPKKQHYNPEAKELVESKGAKVLFLPPQGKYFNTIELAFGTIKTNIRNQYFIRCRKTGS
ncbi:hypothetical protein HDU92_008802 [Lobulomyces angularis]|nr:hypothetical protein HDU92_008802 [Lobulomyces angularis]